MAMHPQHAAVSVTRLESGKPEWVKHLPALIRRDDVRHVEFILPHFFYFNARTSLTFNFT